MINNFLRNPFTHINEPIERYEVVQVPTSTPFICQLSDKAFYEVGFTDIKEMAGAGSVTLTEVFGTTTPNAGEFVVDYHKEGLMTTEGSSRILFNIGDAGKMLVVKYYSLGTLNVKTLIEEKQSEFQPRQFDISFTAGSKTITHFSIYDSGVIYTAVSDVTGIGGTVACGNFRILASDIAAGSYYSSPVAPLNNVISTTLRAFQKIFYAMNTNKQLIVWGYTSTGTQFIKKSGAALNTSSLIGWTAVTFGYGHAFSVAKIQIGNLVYIFGCGTSAQDKNIIFDIDAETTVEAADYDFKLSGINYSQGTACYDGNGNIWIIYGKGNGLYVVKYDIYNNTFTLQQTIGAPFINSILPINMSSHYNIEDDKIYFAAMKVNNSDSIDNMALYSYNFVYDVTTQECIKIYDPKTKLICFDETVNGMFGYNQQYFYNDENTGAGDPTDYFPKYLTFYKCATHNKDYIYMPIVIKDDYSGTHTLTGFYNTDKNIKQLKNKNELMII